MEGDQYSLSWSNFTDNLSSGLHALMQDKNMVDVTIATAQGLQIKAHKIVLAVASPYFKDVFAANPCKHPIVILPHVEYNIMKSLIHFMYVGEVQVSQENIGKFMSLAEFLKVKGLTDNANEFEPNGVDPPVMRPNAAKRPRTMRKMLHPTHYQAIVPKEEPRSPPASPEPSAVVEIYRPELRPPRVTKLRAGPSTSQSQTVVNPVAIPSSQVGIGHQSMSELEEANSSSSHHLDFEPAEVTLLSNNGNHSIIQPKQEPIFHDENTSNSGGEIDISQLLDPHLTNPTPSANSVTPIWPSSILGAPSASPAFLFFRSGRGQLVFVYNGHIYTLFDTIGERKLWICTKARSFFCSGHIVTKAGPAVVSYGNHNHEPLFEVLARLKINPEHVVNPHSIH